MASVKRPEFARWVIAEPESGTILISPKALDRDKTIAIARIVAQMCGIPDELVFNRTTMEEAVVTRTITIHLVLTNTSLSHQEIGRILRGTTTKTNKIGKYQKKYNKLFKSQAAFRILARKAETQVAHASSQT